MRYVSSCSAIHSQLPFIGQLPFADWLEHGFHVQNRRSIQRFEISHPNPWAVDGDDLDAVQPDWVRPVRGTRAEYAAHRIVRVTARVHGQHVAARPIEPCQQDDLRPGVKVSNSFSDVRLENQPRLRSPLVSLLRRSVAINKWRFDMSDRP